VDKLTRWQQWNKLHSLLCAAAQRKGISDAEYEQAERDMCEFAHDNLMLLEKYENHVE
jgi:hypothetical protein